jgi:ABC-type antimicrobial peptide transport system permease subunit
LIAAVREQVRQTSPEVALAYVRSMDDQIDAVLVSERLLATVSSAFGILALALACVGLYGVLAQEVTRRTRDIGIRIALGATRRAVFASVTRRTAAILTVGLSAGLVTAAVASRVLSQLVFGVEPADPVMLVAAAGLLALTAMVAAFVPARRATRIDPIAALRTE